MAKKLMDWEVRNYEDWKKNLWGAFRAFTNGVIAFFIIALSTMDSEVLKDPQAWMYALLMGGLTGGLIALGKFLRDLFPESTAVNKMPF